MWGPFGMRAERRSRFTNWVTGTNGRETPVEQDGPACFEVWEECWRVFHTAALMLGIATPSALDSYLANFRERVRSHSGHWHLCVRADLRARTELWPKERRKFEEWHEAQPSFSTFNPAMPWDAVIRASAEDRTFWEKELRDPSFHLMLGNRTSSTDAEFRKQPREVRPRKPNHTDDVTIYQSQGASTTCGPSSGEACFAWNGGRCQKPCPNKRKHVCKHCWKTGHQADVPPGCPTGPPPSKGKHGKGKGKGKNKKGGKGRHF